MSAFDSSEKCNRKLHDQLTEAGVISDWREPDVIRIAPTPLTTVLKMLFCFVKN